MKIYVMSAVLPLFGLILGLAGCSDVNEDASIYPRDTRDSFEILDTCPSAEQDAISTSAIVRLLFNKELQPSTVHTGAVVLGSGRMFIRANVFYDDRVVTLVPIEPLQPDMLYTVYITTNLRDVDGFSVSGQIEVFSFITGNPGIYTCR